jgi:flavin-dependent dehydrogenase
LEDLEDLNVLDALRRSGAPALHRTVIASARGQVIEAPLPTEALSITRAELDQLLLDEARLAGVDVQEGVAGDPTKPSAEFTVVATGRLSQLRECRQPTPWYASPSTPYFGIQAVFDQVRGVTDQVELDFLDSGYVGLARQAQGVNICALTTQDAVRRWGPDLDRVLAHFARENPVLAEHLRDARRLSPWMSVGPVQLGIRQLAEERTFYVGDAACVVDPFAGEGMSIALYSSRLLVRALDQRQQPAAESYGQMWRDAFMPSLRWNAFMRMLYSVSWFREPSMRVLGWYPDAMNHLTDLTRYRRLELL